MSGFASAGGFAMPCAPSVSIDPRTGRPYGDHGDANDAIEYALEVCETEDEAIAFLRHWREGDLLADEADEDVPDGWPEFYEWLKANGR